MAFLDDAFEQQIENLSEHIVDQSVEENAKFHYESGIRAKVVRTSSGHCCEWCADMAGDYEYPNVPNDVYARHVNCNCTVEYMPGNGRVQDVYTKTWRNENYKTEQVDIEERLSVIDELRKRERKIKFGPKREFERNYQIFHAKKLDHYVLNNLYIDESLTLKPRELRRINTLITLAKETLSVTESCKSPIVIVNDDSILASYNPRTDVFFISSKMSNEADIKHLQKGFAEADNVLSTMIHELLHWKDAEMYRALGLNIDTADEKSPYSIFQRENAIIELTNSGVDLFDIDAIRVTISEYAAKMCLENNYEEVYTEFRTKQILAKD